MQSSTDVVYLPKYFREIEFNTCNPRCELSDMNPEFLKKLDKLREYCGFPLILLCAYRSEAHDKEKGRSGRSFHCKGRAVDIRCVDPYKRHAIVHNAIYTGLNGIGVYKNFIHVDDRAVATMWYGE